MREVCAHRRVIADHDACGRRLIKNHLQRQAHRQHHPRLLGQKRPRRCSDFGLSRRHAPPPSALENAVRQPTHDRVGTPAPMHHLSNILIYLLGIKGSPSCSRMVPVVIECVEASTAAERDHRIVRGGRVGEVSGRWLYSIHKRTVDGGGTRSNRLASRNSFEARSET
jgi:hypothetical protein